MKTFDSEKEAWRFLRENRNELHSVMTRRYCPVVRVRCREDCICFEEAKVKNYGSSCWEIKAAHCTHVLILGVVWVAS